MLKHLSWFILFMALGCQKDNMNDPVSVQFTIDMDRSLGVNGSVQFLQGDLWLDQFLFRGTREGLNDVNFSVSYAGGNGLGISFSSLFIPQLLSQICS